MKLLATNIYEIEIENLISQNCVTSLMLLYQPIIGHESISLYMTLNAESRHNNHFSELSRLLIVTNMNILTLQNAIEKLMEFNLIDLYVNEDNNQYIFHVNPCLSTEDFFRHKVYSRLLLKYQGAENTDVTLTRLKKSYMQKKNMTKITKDLETNIFNDWDEIKELEYDQIKRDRGINSKNYQYNNNFDYNRFLNLATPMNLPFEIRTNENLNRIGELACTYGISPDRMIQHVGHSINLSKNMLNINRLSYLVDKDKSIETKIDNDNPYSLSCVNFLQNKMNGIPVIDYHKKILNNLVENIKLKPDVVNVLIEYILDKSDNILSKNFVESTALIWKQKNIDSIEKAKAFVINNPSDKKVYKKYRKPEKKSLPAYKKGEKAKGDITKHFSDEEEAELMKTLEGMR
jgi:replication initiation and membrane attachment protein